MRSVLDFAGLVFGFLVVAAVAAFGMAAVSRVAGLP